MDGSHGNVVKISVLLNVFSLKNHFVFIFENFLFWKGIFVCLTHPKRMHIQEVENEKALVQH